jgi:hypothetical protein
LLPSSTVQTLQLAQPQLVKVRARAAASVMKT